MEQEQHGTEAAGAPTGIFLPAAPRPLHVAFLGGLVWASSQPGSLESSASFVESKAENLYFVIWPSASPMVTSVVLHPWRRSQKPTSVHTKVSAGGHLPFQKQALRCGQVSYHSRVITAKSHACPQEGGWGPEPQPGLTGRSQFLFPTSLSPA